MFILILLILYDTENHLFTPTRAPISELAELVLENEGRET